MKTQSFLLLGLAFLIINCRPAANQTQPDEVGSPNQELVEVDTVYDFEARVAKPLQCGKKYTFQVLVCAVDRAGAVTEGNSMMVDECPSNCPGNSSTGAVPTGKKCWIKENGGFHLGFQYEVTKTLICP